VSRLKYGAYCMAPGAGCGKREYRIMIIGVNRKSKKIFLDVVKIFNRVPINILDTEVETKKFTFRPRRGRSEISF
jgi:hypothetical protein